LFFPERRTRVTVDPKLGVHLMVNGFPATTGTSPMGAVIAFVPPALVAAGLEAAAGTLAPVGARPYTVDNNAERATTAGVKKRMVEVFIIGPEGTNWTRRRRAWKERLKE